jgi:succinate dehydrogenase hydrophobic anchor subunit
MVAFVLQTVSAVLLIVLLILFVDIARQYRIMEDGVRENSLWSVYQLDREVRQLSHSLANTSRDEPTPKHLDELALRYDILYSRIAILDQAKFGTYFSGDDKVGRYIEDITNAVQAAQPLFDAYAAGVLPTSAQLKQLEASMVPLGRAAEDFLLYTNTRVSYERAESRSTILNLERTSTVMLTLLMVSVVFLVVTLNRQLRSVRHGDAAQRSL